jgi:hypothetical protein
MSGGEVEIHAERCPAFAGPEADEVAFPSTGWASRSGSCRAGLTV